MVTLGIVGFGSRGRMFAQLMQQMENVRLVAVADVAAESLSRANEYGVEKQMQFSSADEFFAQGKICDAVFICTQDSQHFDMTLKALRLGYDVCLEKPAAVTIEECIQIREEAKRLRKKVMLTHVLRYSPFYSYLKSLILSGELGDIVNIDMSENIAYWHFALSYVRGPWKDLGASTPTIIAKCCHDIDIAKWLMDKKCDSVSSYGNLYYFNSKHAPKGSAANCADCAEEVKRECPYNAYAVYPEKMQKSVIGGMERLKGKNIFEVLDEKRDDIAKCVFHSDNDAVDNQVVNMLFEDGSTANLTMTAFSEDCHRTIYVHGTKGEAFGDLEDGVVQVNIFHKERRKVDVNTEYNQDGVDLSGGHGGGDYYLLKDFIEYITVDGESLTRTTIEESIESHIIGFKAEESRVNGGKSVKLP